jgi:RHS repeat-associated protein
MASPLKLCRANLRFVGDPIDVVTGANTDSPVDLTQRGPILFQWVRYYSSARSDIHSSLGWGHSHEFDRVLHRDLDGLRYEDPFGAVVGFPDLPVGGEAIAGGLLLTRAAEHLYVVSRTDQPDEEFEFSSLVESARLARLRQGEHTIELHYGDRGQLDSIVDSRRRLIRVSYDPAGRVTRLGLVDPKTGVETRLLLAYEYDLAGNLIRATDYNNTTLSFAYDAANRMVRRTDRRGYSFTFEYDDEGRCSHSRGEDGLLEVFLDYRPILKTTIVRHGDGGQWTYIYDDAGTVTRRIDPFGGVTSYTVDTTGRVTEEIDPNGNVTQLLYDDLGHHYARLDPFGHELPTADEDPEPDPLTYDLPDSALEWECGNIAFAEDIHALGVDDPILSLVPPRVRSAVVENAPTQAPGVFPSSEEDTDIGDTRPDEAGQIVEDAKSASPQRWQYDPNGNLAEYRDRDGSTYRFTYSSWNLPYQEIDPLGNTATFLHAPNLELSRVVDPGGTEHEYIYDLKDRLVEIRYHGRLLEQLRYDRADNVIEKRDGAGRALVSWEITAGNVDRARRLGTGELHEFQHDESGRVTQATAPEATVTRAYDEDGCLIQDQCDGLGVEHTFDIGRVIIATTYLDRFLVTYNYDEDGNHVITDPTGAVHRTAVSDNGLIHRQLAGGTRELIQFDTEGRCLLKATMKDGAASIRKYTYSPEGDLRSVADNRLGITKYDYDAAHRLTHEHLPSGTRAFAYDPAGNLLLQPGLDHVEIEAGNRIRSANGDSFSYDRRDNVATRAGTSGVTYYQYDDLDRLVRCEINGEPWAAAYDALDRRIRKTWRGQTAAYYWDGFRLAAERRADGSLRLYIYEDHVALVPFMFVEYAHLDADPESGERYYIFTNQIGVPIRVEDAAGKQCWAARIDPYGRAEISANSLLEMPLRFPGHYHDPEIDLHYNYLRYYSPSLGRYLRPDPLGIEGGLNLFAYVDNPLIDVDLDGLKSCPPAKKPTKKPPKAKSSKKPKPKKPKKKAKKKDPYARPSGFRKGVRQKVWNSAKGPDGKVRDPQTKKVMKFSKAWDMGHKRGYEFRKHRASAKKRKISRKKFLDEHNVPSHYRPELPSSNRNHKGEKKTGKWKG